MWVCERSDKQRESFLPNTDYFLAFFIVFEWGRILESATDKQRVKRIEQLRSNYFSVNVSVLAVVFRRQINKKTIKISSYYLENFNRNKNHELVTRELKRK